MVLTAEILDVVVFLVEVEVEITAALGAFQPPGEHARLLGNSRLLTACTFLHGLHLFPCGRSMIGSWTLRKIARFSSGFSMRRFIL